MSPGRLAFEALFGSTRRLCPGHEKLPPDAPEPWARVFCPGCREWHPQFAGTEPAWP